MADIHDLQRFAVWIWRWRHCQGFGVQSPWAYSFIRDVVNERNPYYAYERLEQQFGGGTAGTRKLLRLYLRLANYLQPRFVADFGINAKVAAAYVTAGCNRAQVTAVGTEADSRAAATAIGKLPQVDMARFSPSAAMAAHYAVAAERATEASAFVIEGIRSDRHARALWRNILADNRTSVTFDLYYCGIVFFDTKRHKHNYIVNF